MSNSNDTGIRWEEPPTRNSRNNPKNWIAIVASLKERPGQWALVAENASATMVTHLKKGIVGGAHPGDIETRSVTTGEGRRANIYARWVGETK